MSEYIAVESAEGSIWAYVAFPRVVPAPAVVVIQEMLGRGGDSRETCDVLAEQGYIAVSPEMFWRMEREINMSDLTEPEWKKDVELNEAFIYHGGIEDVAIIVDVARTLRGSSRKVGLVGFCMGGLMAFIASARKGADASVVYYGANMDRYLEEARAIANPLLIHLGEKDEYIPKSAREAIIASLKDNKSAEVITYPGCHHAFAQPGGGHFDAASATLAHARTDAFLRANLM